MSESCSDDDRPFIIEDAVPESALPISRQREVIVGWRVWRVAAGELRSVFMSSTWPAGIAMKACCANAECGLRHGIHAYARKEQAEQYIREGDSSWGYSTFGFHLYVFGEVSLWGRVVIHENGYRAEYAYPRRLSVPPASADLAGVLRRAYGVEVEVV